MLELGSGPGYFSTALARRVSRGYLLVVDLQSEMLQKARRNVARAGLRKAGFVQADGAA